MGRSILRGSWLVLLGVASVAACGGRVIEAPSGSGGSGGYPATGGYASHGGHAGQGGHTGQGGCSGYGGCAGYPGYGGNAGHGGYGGNAGYGGYGASSGGGGLGGMGGFGCILHLPAPTTCSDVTFGAKCDPCMQAHCCDIVNACLSDTACQLLANCHRQCDTTSDPNECVNMYCSACLGGATLYNVIGKCLQLYCANQCP